MPSANVNGIDVHYERGGDGPAAAVLQRLGRHARVERAGDRPFREHFDVVAHDQRGLGRTTIPPGPYSMADYAADAAALLDHVGWERCARRRHQLRRDGRPGARRHVAGADRPASRSCARRPAEPGARRTRCTSSPSSRRPRRRRSALTLLDTRFSREWLADAPAGPGARRDAARRATGAPKSAEERRGELAQLDARRRHDVWDRLPRVTCPTLVAGGRYDGIAPPANSEAIASRIPGAELRLYEGGHLFFLQDRAAFPDILDFLAAG